MIPRVMIIGKLACYSISKKAVMLAVEHRQHRGLNNRAEDNNPIRSIKISSFLRRYSIILVPYCSPGTFFLSNRMFE